MFRPDGLFSRGFLQWLEREEGSVLLETVLTSEENKHHHLFFRPSAVLEATSVDQVESVLQDVDHALRSGSYVAGTVSYEAGYAFESVLPRPPTSSIPLISFGIYDEPVTIRTGALSPETGQKRFRQLQSEFESFSPFSEDPPSLVPVASMTEDEHRKAVARIRRLIVEGETYQVNLTFKLRFPLRRGLAAVYDALRRAQQVSYAAFVNMKRFSVLSFSPELFFRVEGEHMTLKPMKGTAPRGRTTEEDMRSKEWLQSSEKNRAENLMIVDLLRNDAGRIAQPGGVSVKQLFDIERYETLYQATSTINACLRKDVRPSEIFRCLFPCGSVTGAPKIRTMQIIQKLEKEPRGLYTGSVGFFSPARKAVFSVAIRTLVVDRESGRAEFGVGSGIVHDSKPDLEYAECLLKAKFLTDRSDEFKLIETLRWNRADGWVLLDGHLRRLKESSEYFGFLFDEKNAVQTLLEVEEKLRKLNGEFRGRLTLDRTGHIEIAHSPLEPMEEPVRAVVSPLRTDSGNRFLYHKTTRREFYEQELKRATENGFYDVLFRNERGEITEGARTNIMIRKGGTLFTPPVACGLLPGTFRAYLLRSGSERIVERPMSLDEMLGADEVLLCNAVRGLVKACVVLPARGVEGQGSIVVEQERNDHGRTLADEN